jgi:outer membrane receptor protein involved in Fe transport
VRPYGQLDAFASYKFNAHATLVIEASNVTDAMTRTVEGVGTQQHGRDWFVTDRRIGTSLRFSF